MTTITLIRDRRRLGVWAYSIAVPASHGTFSALAPNMTYTPDPNYYGLDSFTFSVSDTASPGNNPGQSDQGAVTIRSTPSTTRPASRRARTRR